MNVTILVDSTQVDLLFSKLQSISENALAIDVGRIGVGLVRSNFQNQTSFDGSPWVNLSKYTISKRVARGNNSTLKLIDTGKLFSSVKARISGNSAELIAGSNTIDAVTHNEGDLSNTLNGKSAPIPKRAFMPDENQVPNSWYSQLLKPLDDAITKAIT